MTLPVEVLRACKNYYVNRDNQEETKWNKEHDLDEIVKLCRKYKLGFNAVVGHFWFWSATEEIEIDTDNIDNLILRSDSKLIKWLRK